MSANFSSTWIGGSSVSAQVCNPLLHRMCYSEQYSSRRDLQGRAIQSNSQCLRIWKYANFHDNSIWHLCSFAKLVSTSSQLDEKVADPHYRHGPGQPLSSTLARRVRVQPLLLSLLLFGRGVRGHRRLDLFKGPWPLLWGRGELAERGLVRLGLCLKTAVLSVCSLSASFNN